MPLEGTLSAVCCVSRKYHEALFCFFICVVLRFFVGGFDSWKADRLAVSKQSRCTCVTAFRPALTLLSGMRMQMYPYQKINLILKSCYQMAHYEVERHVEIINNYR